MIRLNVFIRTTDSNREELVRTASIGRFFFHDRGQGGHFFRSKSDMLSLFQPVIIPKGSMFFLHPFHESVSTHIPINLVSIRNKKGG